MDYNPIHVIPAIGRGKSIYYYSCPEKYIALAPITQRPVRTLAQSLAVSRFPVLYIPGVSGMIQLIGVFAMIIICDVGHQLPIL